MVALDNRQNLKFKFDGKLGRIDNGLLVEPVLGFYLDFWDSLSSDLLELNSNFKSACNLI